MKRLALRYFTPAEVAALHCFPPGFAIPAAVSVRQAYACLGNSLNVKVVAELLAHLLSDTKTAEDSAWQHGLAMPVASQFA